MRFRLVGRIGLLDVQVSLALTTIIALSTGDGQRTARQVDVPQITSALRRGKMASVGRMRNGSPSVGDAQQLGQVFFQASAAPDRGDVEVAAGGTQARTFGETAVAAQGAVNLCRQHTLSRNAPRLSRLR
jgi:hypothetical protein